MIALSGLDHVCLRVADLDAAAARWTAQFGLTERFREDGRIGLACDDEPLALELIPGEPGLDHVAWRLARGCEPEETELRDPEGNAVHLLPFAEPASRWVAHARPAAAAAPGHPRRLGHVNFLTGDIRAQVAWWTEHMGMKLSDRLGEGGAWLRLSHHHHELAFVQPAHPPAPHLHHIALDVVDIGQMRAALDHLGRHGRWLGWGPTRHGVGGNIASYVRITEEPLFVELYCDMELLEPDHEPRVYPDDRYSSNTWGPLPPRSYFRFDADAVASERDSLEMQGVPL